MAMQCPRCAFHDETNTATICPRCGVTMRFSLLADYKPPEDKDAKATVTIEEPLGTKIRVRQWIKGMVVTQLLVLLIAGGTIGYLIVVKKIRPGDLQNEAPALRTQIMYGIPVAAVAFGVVFTCANLYMSQFIGMAVGIATAALFLSGRSVVGTVDIKEWFILPGVLGVTGFLVGLVVAGRLKAKPVELQYKPIDTWDRSAEARYHEMAPSAQTRLNRLLFGIAAGIGTGELLFLIVRAMMMATYKNPAMVKSLMEEPQFDMSLKCVAALVAGVGAGSGTLTGKTQGLMAGLGVFGYVYYMNPPPDTTEKLILTLVPMLIAGIIGGVLGRRIFAPYKVFTGPKLRPEDYKF